MYYLKCKDYLVALIDDNFSILDRFEKFYFENEFWYWLNCRVMSRNRKYSEELYNYGDISSFADFIKVSKALSLFDSYWITDNPDETWASVNLFRNDINHSVSKIASGKTKQFPSANKLSPEWTLQGDGCRFVRKEYQTFYLYKNSGFDGELENSGVYSEFLVSQIFRYLGFKNYLHCDIVEHYGKLYSKCELPVSEDRTYVPMEYLSTSCSRLNEHIRTYSGFNKVYFRILMIIDALVCNMGRSKDTWGIIQETGEFAPFSNYDRSLFYDKALKGCEALDILKYLETHHPLTWLRHTFDDQFRFCMTKDVYKHISKLKGFNFKNHKDYPMDDMRLFIINSVFHYRLEKLLGDFEKVV